MAQIFLSYSRKDFDSAKAVAGALGERGHTVWWDKHISGGSKFAFEIEQALANADIVIVLWSKDAVSSAWVLDEAAEGRDSDKLLPVALDGCKPPLGFRQFQTIAANNRLETALEEIGNTIEQRAGRAMEHTGRGHAAGAAFASHHALVERLLEQGQVENAWREMETVFEHDAHCADTNRQAGWILYLQGRLAESAQFYEKAVASEKGDHESAAMLISCYRTLQDHAAVRRAAAHAVARSEQSIAAAINSGAAFASGAKGLAALDHSDRAKKWIRKALNVDPGNLAMRYKLASTLASLLHDFDATIDVLEPFAEAASKRIHVLLLESDPDWTDIKQTGPFQALLDRARKRVNALELAR